MSVNPRECSREDLRRGFARGGRERTAVQRCCRQRHRQRAFPAVSGCASKNNLPGRCSSNSCVGAAPKRLIMLLWFQGRLGCHTLPSSFNILEDCINPEFSVLGTYELKDHFLPFNPKLNLFSVCSVIMGKMTRNVTQVFSTGGTRRASP